MTHKALSPEAETALQNAMRKACERMERARAEREADQRAEAAGRLADAMGANV